EFERGHEGKTLGLDLAENLLERHFVLVLDGNLQVLAAKLDEYQPSTRTQRLAKTAESRLGVGAFVINIDHENQVNLAVGQHRVLRGAEQRLDVVHSGGLGVLLEHL